MGKTYNKRYEAYEIPTLEGISDYVSHIIINSITGRPLFSQEEVLALLRTSAKVISIMLLAGYRVHVDDLASMYIKKVDTPDAPDVGRSVKARPVGETWKGMLEKSVPANARDVYMHCLTEKQKDKLERLGTMEERLAKRNKKINFQREENDKITFQRNE